MVQPPPFEKGKTLFAGLYIIWIINQKQQHQSDSVALNKNNTLIFNINKLSVQFSFNKSVVVLLACVFCWVLLCNTTLFYFIYVSFCAKNKKFP